MTKRNKRCNIKSMIRKLFTVSVAALFILSSCKSTKPAPVQEEEPEQPSQEQILEDEEFNRSTAGVEISREEFNADKNEILRIIGELSSIMTDYDYESWVSYISPASVEYWSNSKNLLGASKRLPQKIRLSNLNDYFRYVFVPSRKGRSVEEIRYISRDSVKAVQVREDRDIVYYNFVREEGKWMVSLPELQN